MIEDVIGVVDSMMDPRFETTYSGHPFGGCTTRGARRVHISSSEFTATGGASVEPYCLEQAPATGRERNCRPTPSLRQAEPGSLI